MTRRRRGEGILSRTLYPFASFVSFMTSFHMKTELKDRCSRIEEAYRVHARVRRAGAADRAWQRIGISDPRDADGVQQLADRPRRICSRRSFARTSSSRPRRYDNFIAVLDRDAKDAQAGVQLALAQPSISSQMIDNLNASIHLRALLTDLFLIDEIVRPEAVSPPRRTRPLSNETRTTRR